MDTPPNLISTASVNQLCSLLFSAVSDCESSGHAVSMTSTDVQGTLPPTDTSDKMEVDRRSLSGTHEQITDVSSIN